MSDETDRTKTALALSGGGFRATLYHIGALVRLNELGLLAQIERISSVSGGAIAAGKLAEAWPRLKRSGDRFENIDAEVFAPLRSFCQRHLDTLAAGWGTLLPGKTIGDVLAGAYDEALFGNRWLSLRTLVDKPQFIFNATNLQTGRLVRFSKVRLADYTIGEVPNPDIPLARAVAASSAFPPVLSPVTVDVSPASWQDLKGTQHFGDPAYTRKLSLTDGGAYDNLGLETVDDFATIVVSDGGAPFSTEESADAFWPQQALRALDIATDQARGLRKRLLYAESSAAGRKYAYAGIDGDPAAFGIARTLQVDVALTRPLARIRTRLNPFSEQEQGQLINWGWYMMDLAIRNHIAPTAPAPTKWPCPAQNLS
ncbi:patatin-like phospholipase family protein [Mesorhizobium sp. M0482]|uniref:patatin-like phospholipase family protein n=1 Tax=Mesorhizobium sp. M0482 TaxID=2956948 RepID=UPI003339DA2B